MASVVEIAPPIITPFQPFLTASVGREGAWTLEDYLSRGGYTGWRRAVTELAPAEVTDMVKRSNLRGRGGAGFSTGTKWGFVPPLPGPKYVCCNADESEPGTFNNRAIMEWDPHIVLEGVMIASYAIGATHSFIYCRGEFGLPAKRLNEAIREAEQAGLLGSDIFGKGVDLKITVYRGAGAYICGEETALLESLEGKRPMPRSRPPFPAVVGLYGRPTVINNAETLANVPFILKNGPEWYAGIGTAPNSGPKVFSLSGSVNQPGNYELPLGITLRELVAHGGGIRDGRKLKAVIPGGSSAAILPATLPDGKDVMDLVMDFDACRAAGSMLGSGAVMVLDETVCMACAVTRFIEFYQHESCGKCTPCREGTSWILRIMQRVTGSGATEGDLFLVNDLASHIPGRSLCLLGDSAATPIMSALKHFRGDFEAHVATGHCPDGCIPF